MSAIKRRHLRNILTRLLQEEYGPFQDPSDIFPGQTEELRSMNDQLQAKKQGTYSNFVQYLKDNVGDPKLRALLNSGHFDGSLEDDAVIVNEEDIFVSELQPTQSEIGMADSIAWVAENAPEKGADLASGGAGTVADVGGRIITADGKFVLDGHHRWSQVYLLNPSAKIPAYNIITKPSPVPGESNESGQDYLKMTQILIGAVDGVIPSKPADTATDIYRTGGNQEKIKEMLMDLVPMGSKFASALIEKKFGAPSDSAGEQLMSGEGTDLKPEDKLDLSQPQEMEGSLDASQGPALGSIAAQKQEKEGEIDDLGPTDATGKVLATATSGDQEEGQVDSPLNEIFRSNWVVLSEQTEMALSAAGAGAGATDDASAYENVIDRLTTNAIMLYNRTYETAATMSPRSDMPQLGAGGSSVEELTDALESGHVDWQAPYDESDMAIADAEEGRKDIAINEVAIRQMIRNSIRKALKG